LARELLEGLGIDVVDNEEARDAFREVAAVPRLEHALRTVLSAYDAPLHSVSEHEVAGRRSGVGAMRGAVVSAVVS
jgi:hypothetical protein